MTIDIQTTRCGVAPQIRPQLRVAVCGDSLYMAGLAAGLGLNPDVAVVRIAAEPTLAQAIEHLSFSVIAFDLCEMPGDLAISLLRDHPDLILIGIDPSDDKTLVLSGREEQPLSAAELVRIIAENRAAIETYRKEDPTKTSWFVQGAGRRAIARPRAARAGGAHAFSIRVRR